MIEIRTLKTNRGYERFKMEGHANFNPGNDIVCAAISALAYTLIASLDTIEDISIKELNVSSGLLHVEIEPFIDEAIQNVADIIFDTILRGMELIEVKYPKHVEIQKFKK